MFSTKFIVFTVCCIITLGHALTVEILSNSMEEMKLPVQLLLVLYRPMEAMSDNHDGHESMPASKVRRQIFGRVTPGILGVAGALGAKRNIFNDNGHSIKALDEMSKTIRPMGPTNVGAGFKYQGPHAGATVRAVHTHGYGTDLGARANINLWRSQNGMTTIGVEGRYDRHFGGTIGTNRPSYGAGAIFNHRF